MGIMSYFPWGTYSMFNRSQNGTDFAWLANEISAIRSGVDTLTRDSATHKERITSVIQDVSRLDARLSTNDSKISLIENTVRDLQITNVKKDSAWSGPVKIAAALPVIAVLLTIFQYLVSLGLLSIVK
jgi:hypothetical protein